MKKYQTNDGSINESKAELSLLSNLLDFYISKYASSSIEATEHHFLNALGSLVDRGEIDERVVKEFLDDKGIEGEIPKFKPKSHNSSNSSNSSNYDPCGRTSYNSHC